MMQLTVLFGLWTRLLALAQHVAQAGLRKQPRELQLLQVHLRTEASHGQLHEAPLQLQQFVWVVPLRLHQFQEQISLLYRQSLALLGDRALGLRAAAMSLEAGLTKDHSKQNVKALVSQPCLDGPPERVGMRKALTQ